MTRRHRITRWVRFHRHEMAERQVMRLLRSANPEDVPMLRARGLELTLCPDPGDPDWCGCLDATPVRKLVTG